MCNITKSFGSNEVLKSVNFSLRAGEICALLGENGAGKSTLMNILGGVLQPDTGDILLDERKVAFQNPMQSLGEGIAFIHQELNLINDLPVYENMFIGRELKNKRGFLDHKRMIHETEVHFKKMGLEISSTALVRTLDASYKQIVEIARALMMNASIIIMDEPTTSLTDPEIERVFNMLRGLKQQKVGIVFISHKLREVMEICDRYTVLRDGVMVAEGTVANTTTRQIARDMVGHDVRTEALQRGRTLGNDVLELRNLSAEPHFRNINLTLRTGEVLGITGLLGDGRSELFRTVFGAEGNYTGDILVEGIPVRIHTTMQAKKLGIGYVPRNRKENGILKHMNILENGSIVTWPELTDLLMINSVRQNQEFSKQEKDLRIKLGSRTDNITSLSGGNQQKVVLAKWLSADPKVLILDNPTQGVDVGAKEDIYDIILRLADSGVSIVVLSSEAQEIIRVCDRALVMYHGVIQAQVSGETMNEHEIMHLATGAGQSVRGE